MPETPPCRRPFVATLLLALLAACGGPGEPGPEDPGPQPSRTAARGASPRANAVDSSADWARQLTVRGASDEPGATFYKPDVEVMESMPVQFALQLLHDLPMAGGSLVCDDVRVDEKAARIVAQITSRLSDGPSATVITPTAVRLPFGTLRVGRYRLDLLLRRSKDARYELMQSLTLTAK